MFKDKQESVALFGGSFDPPHLGHLSIIEEALKLLEIDRVIVIPTFLNPFKSSSEASPLQRLKWSKELFGTISKVFISDYEINQGKSIKTSQTLAHFQQQYSVKYIIIGADNLASIHKWHNFQILNEQIDWIIATRESYALDTTALRVFKLLKVDINISSTQIREQNKGKK
ncbi:MAG: nicotinate (nicotinamide) nucleotide adenylyltransferase [Sulfurovaceae bacterium]|nr:nicotinate (nicotinamide) nucleotide adenylyltransferase [Sulfurovaceae bacterium]